MDRYHEQKGQRPAVFLANMGPVSQHKLRADFTQTLFETVGFEILNEGHFQSPLQAAGAAAESCADVAIICSTDETYPDLVPQWAGTLKACKPELILGLAGYPEGFVEEFRKLGINEFIHLRANALETLTRILTQLKILNDDISDLSEH